ncbi:MAG: cellulose binding domain-containing protein [Erysipelotrichaceae bacterium]|nr:cellulose binding domain-containing protein [Erysipelotrichaceae bacterium]
MSRIPRVKLITLVVALSFTVVLSGCDAKKPVIDPEREYSVAISTEYEDDSPENCALKITITNKSQDIITDWELSFDAESKITDVIDCTFYQKGKRCSVSSSVYNHVILPGESYKTTIIMAKRKDLSNLRIEGKTEKALYADAKLSGQEFRYDSGMKAYFITTVVDSLGIESEEAVFTDYEIRNCDDEVFKAGKVKEGRIEDVGLDIGYNEIRLTGYIGGKTVISYIGIQNLEDENAIKAGFDLESDKDQDGVIDHFEKRLGLDPENKYSVDKDRTDFEVLFEGI